MLKARRPGNQPGSIFSGWKIEKPGFRWEKEAGFFVGYCSVVPSWERRLVMPCWKTLNGWAPFRG
jgi:hypothetical protein